MQTSAWGTSYRLSLHSGDCSTRGALCPNHPGAPWRPGIGDSGSNPNGTGASAHIKCHSPYVVFRLLFHNPSNNAANSVLLPNLFHFYLFCLFAFSRANPSAYGGSQARGPTGAVAASLCQNHSNAGSTPHLRPTPQLMATPDP